MSKARLVVTGVSSRIAGRGCPRLGVSQGSVSRLVARYRAEGEAAFRAVVAAPATSPNAISDQVAELVAELIVALRKYLTGNGLDAGPHTICWHLQHQDGSRCRQRR
jgi:hypothetical protein